MKITKTDLFRAIAAEAGISRRASVQATKTVLDTMMESLAAGDEVRIGGFGKFHVKTLAARTARHPRSRTQISVARRRSVGFKCFQGLRQRLNPSAELTPLSADHRTEKTEQRREDRQEILLAGRACVRISGIPVCDFPIKDLSGNGSCILVEAQSMIMRNIRIGQEIELHIPSTEYNHRPVLQRSQITHITRQGEKDRYPGYVLVGVRVLDRLPPHP